MGFLRSALVGIFLLLSSGGVLHAQIGENLIQNWSFETRRINNQGDTSCPSSAGQVFFSKYWNQAFGSPDYFNACSNETYPNYGVPWNAIGFQEAYDGNAYVLVGCYSASTVDLREFLFQELEEPLAAGRQYRLDFRVSLADSFNFAISSMGALLSIENTRDEQWQPEDFFASSPQVLNPWENLLDDKEGWTLISDTFIAQGGEKYLSIGCFRRDAEDNIQRVSSHPHGIYYWEESGYRVDGVELYEDRGIGIEEADASNLSIYPNPANDIITIATTDKHAKALEVVDLAGRMVVSTVMASVKEVVSIGHLPSGVYVVAITFGDGSIARQRCFSDGASFRTCVVVFGRKLEKWQIGNVEAEDVPGKWTCYPPTSTVFGLI